MRPSYKVVLTARARNDFIDIGDYIAYNLSVPATAFVFVESLVNAILTLGTMPERYALVDDEVLAGYGIRCMPYKNYYVFYRVSHAERQVSVLRVGYNRKNWQIILRRDVP